MSATLPVTVDDYRELARGRLPRFLFDYLDGGAGTEQTLAVNTMDWARLRLRQRALIDVGGIDTSTQLFGASLALPVAFAPIGLAGMMARRGEVQAVRAANAIGIPFTLSTVGLCGIDEVATAAHAPFWFQLYMLRDRGVANALLDRAWAAGCRTLMFTIDLPMPGPRHRDIRNGLAVPGRRAKLLRTRQLLARPGWIWDVAMRGGPLRLGSLGEHVPAARDLDAFRQWVDQQFDPTVTWADIVWLRQRWRGTLLLKGILDADDARASIDAGADGIVVSNHGGRQLDGAASTASKLPAIVNAVGASTQVLVDGGIRSGIDVFRALALGARGVLIGRPWVYALAAGGEPGVRALLSCWQRELATTMALTGVTRIDAIGSQQLDPI
ncbi:MAG: L-lactate dehydrogenase [Rhodanobacteraceae bacterium]|nr:L-lactate dehydrogenase [Rhodanobacteraceae bacterium]MBP9154761.1 L-lactate dehydrogenase [Xanthomonadales bacterium]HQW82261.1 L-lactate dehydrogenase [Pseudomonadota bacterium]